MLLKVFYILSRNEINLLIPLGITHLKRSDLLRLGVCELEIFVDKIQVLYLFSFDYSAMFVNTFCTSSSSSILSMSF